MGATAVGILHNLELDASRLVLCYGNRDFEFEGAVSITDLQARQILPERIRDTPSERHIPSQDFERDPLQWIIQVEHPT
jgi:hypothetical protein